MITDMLKRHLEAEKASFHMPGHKNGVGLKGMPFSKDIFSLDTTELWGTDALIHPEDEILEAEKQAAKYYGAHHSFYLVNGSTGGILTMMFHAFRPGDMVLIDRCCHQSVLHAAALTGIVPIYVAPEASALAGVPGTVDSKSIQQLLKKFPTICGAVITSPNYYGAVAPISEIAEILHKHQAVLLVDEAHGAHFPFSSLLPQSAMEQGADMSVTSSHKSLPAPNQTALLHIGKGLETEDVRKTVRMFQTSSPSYVLLAAMEYALDYAATQGEEETQKLLARLDPLSLPRLQDPFKLLPSWAEKGISGYRAEEILRTKFGIYSEMADAHRVLFMTSWCTSNEDIRLLAEAIHYLDALPSEGKPLTAPINIMFEATLPTLTPAEARQRTQKRVPLSESVGKICAAAVSAFPPCIPLLLPGEKITESTLAQISKLAQQGVTITGIEHDTICVIK